MSKNYKKIKKDFLASGPSLINLNSMEANYLTQKNYVEQLNIDALKFLSYFYNTMFLGQKISLHEIQIVQKNSDAG